MAITPAQRSTALQAIVQAAIQGQAALDTLLPGTTPAQVLTFLVNGLGTTADAFYTTALANIVTNLQAQEVGYQNAAAAVAAQITANTVV